MKNNTPPHLSQSLTPDEAKASLGIASRLQMQHVMPMVAPKPQAPQTNAQNANPAPQPPTNQQNPTDVNQQITALEGRVMDEMSQLKEEIRKVGAPQDQNKEILDLKNQIEAILNES